MLFGTASRNLVFTMIENHAKQPGPVLLRDIAGLLFVWESKPYASEYQALIGTHFLPRRLPTCQRFQRRLTSEQLRRVSIFAEMHHFLRRFLRSAGFQLDHLDGHAVFIQCHLVIRVVNPTAAETHGSLADLRPPPLPVEPGTAARFPPIRALPKCDAG